MTLGSGIHVGIDLGTSNSAIAVFDGDAVSVVANALGETLTPSVVRVDARGGRTVGPARASAVSESDPANTRAEWKRLMGTAERLRFEAAGAALLPEELSAEVLASLLADVRDAAGLHAAGGGDLDARALRAAAEPRHDAGRRAWPGSRRWC